MMKIIENNMKDDIHQPDIVDRKSKRLKFFVCIFLILAILAVYWQALNSEFVNFDDNLYVTDNEQVKVGLTHESVAWAFSKFYIANWHPLTWLSHMLDIEIYGLNPKGHHLTNIFFHIFNTLLLFGVLIKMTGALWQSTLVALLFAVHPFNVESVAWVSERKNVLSTFFWFLTMWAYADYVVKKNLGTYLLVVLFLGLGLMSKPMLVTLPFALILLDYWPLKRWGWKGVSSQVEMQGRYIISENFGRIVLEKVPLFLLVLGSCITTYLAQQGGGAMRSTASHSLSINISNAVISYLTYLEKMILPHNLSVLYPHPGNAISTWKASLCALALMVITIGVVWLIRRAPYLAVGWFWYLGTLVPVIGVVQVGFQAMADRYMYVPLVGIFIAIAWGLPDLMGKSKQKLLTIFMGAFICMLMFFAWHQVSYWRNSIVLFNRVIELDVNKHPHLAVAHSNLAHALYEKKEYEDVLAHFNEALRLIPAYKDAFDGIEMARDVILDYNEAEARKTLNLEPNNIKAHYDLGKVLNDLMEYEESIIHFKEAINIQPEFAEAHNKLGIAYNELMMFEEAINSFKEAVRLAPDNLEFYENKKFADEQMKLQ